MNNASGPSLNVSILSFTGAVVLLMMLLAYLLYRNKERREASKKKYEFQRRLISLESLTSNSDPEYMRRLVEIFGSKELPYYAQQTLINIIFPTVIQSGSGSNPSSNSCYNSNSDRSRNVDQSQIRVTSSHKESPAEELVESLLINQHMAAMSPRLMGV